MVAETVPLANMTPEAVVVPPINALPVIPTPPETVKAPVVMDVELVRFVTATPDALTIPELGLITNEVIVDKPKPLLLEELTAVMKKDWFNVVGNTATDDAAAGGTACQVGSAPAPLEVKTCPLELLAANLPQAVVVVA